MKWLLVLFITFIVGCNLFDEDDGVLFVFTEMQCVEYSWENSDDEIRWASNVKSYLEDEGISVNSITGINDEGVYCRACEVCPTGRFIEVWIAAGDADLMDGLGFVEG